MTSLPDQKCYRYSTRREGQVTVLGPQGLCKHTGRRWSSTNYLAVRLTKHQESQLNGGFGSTGALQAYRKALELKRSAAHQEREARRMKLQRARRVRASRFAEAHALENGDAAPLHTEVGHLCLSARVQLPHCVPANCCRCVHLCVAERHPWAV